MIVAEADMKGAERMVGGDAVWCLPDHLLSTVFDALHSLATRAQPAPLIERHNICGWLWRLVEQVLVKHAPRSSSLTVEDYLSLAIGEITHLLEKVQPSI